MSEWYLLSEAINELNQLWPLLDIADPQRDDLLIARNVLYEKSDELMNHSALVADICHSNTADKLEAVIYLTGKAKRSLESETQRQVRVAEVIHAVNDAIDRLNDVIDVT